MELGVDITEIIGDSIMVEAVDYSVEDAGIVVALSHPAGYESFISVYVDGVLKDLAEGGLSIEDTENGSTLTIPALGKGSHSISVMLYDDATLMAVGSVSFSVEVPSEIVFVPVD